jgi:chromosome segregation ATPase
MLNASVTADAHRDRYRLAWMSARLGRAAERERAESLFYDREKAKRTTATVRGELFTARATVRRADERLAEVLAERDALRAKLEKARARTARLEEDAAVLAALRAVGVDNWDGYSDAMAALYEAEGS